MEFKLIVVALVLAAVADAEPPRFRSWFLQRQEIQEAPYPAAGSNRPQGQQFQLPQRQEILPASYGPPQADATTAATTASTATTEENPTTIEPLNDSTKNITEKKANLTAESDEVEEIEPVNVNTQDQPQQGIYYVLLPTGQLQKVQYFTANDQPNMAFRTQLQYQSVEPIQGPVYTFDPNGQFLQLVL